MEFESLRSLDYKGSQDDASRVSEGRETKLYLLGSKKRRLQDADLEECGMILEKRIMRGRPNKLSPPCHYIRSRPDLVPIAESLIALDDHIRLILDRQFFIVA